MSPQNARPMGLYYAILPAVFSLILLVGTVGTFSRHDLVPALQELRALARFPTSADLEHPAAIPGKLTDFFNDNFGGRKLLVREYFRFRLRVLQADVGLPAILGKNGWLISIHEIAAYRNDPLMPPARVERIRLILNSWCIYARARGAVMVFMIGPNKTSIYPEVPDYLPKKNQPSTIDRLNDLKIECPLIKVDLRPTLLANAQEQLLYFKWGTHWNNAGALLAWKEMKAAVERSGRRLRWPVSQVTTSQRPALPWEDSSWTWYGLRDPEQLQLPTVTFEETKYPEGPTGDPAPRAKILAFGDSYLLFMQPTAREVVGTFTAWNMNVQDKFAYKAEDLDKDGWILAAHPEQKRIDLMDVFHPNVVLLEIVERGIDQLADFPLPPDAEK